MSGRIISLNRYRKESGKGNDDCSEDEESQLSTSELYAAADSEFYDDIGRRRKHDRIRASLHVLLADPEEMQNSLREAVVMAGMLREIPQSNTFPLTAGPLKYGSAEDIRDLGDNEQAKKYMEEQQLRRSDELAAYREWATGLMKDLTMIAESRMRGVEADDILSTSNLRLSLTTEMLSQQMLERILGTRAQVRDVINDLAEQSEANVKAAPLAVSMRRIGKLCHQMNEDLEQLANKANEAAGNARDDRENSSHTKATSLAMRAKEIFRPFIKGNHVITMQQLHELEGFLLEAGTYNENVGAVIQDGIQAIQEAKEAGRHKEIRTIEGFLQFDVQLAGFERVTRALDNNFRKRAGIVANSGMQNRIILQRTPAALLRQAEIESGLERGELLENAAGCDMNLVLPASNDLELKRT